MNQHGGGAFRFSGPVDGGAAQLEGKFDAAAYAQGVVEADGEVDGGAIADRRVMPTT